MTNSEVLIRAENVSKKFCRRLRQSLWYGMKDLASELTGRSNRPTDLRKDEFWAVSDVSFELRRGECLGLIGKNGAGKSTLLRLLNGLIKLDKGRITVRGRVGALIELGAGFNPILTGRENIYVNAAVLGIPKQEVDRSLDSIIEFAEIGDFIDMPVQHYSSGMRVRLGFAVAAQLNPDVLIVDEVLAVGDTGFKMKCLNRINALMQNSAAIFVSHSMELVSWVCTRVIVLNKGQVEHHGGDVSAGIDHYYTKFGSHDETLSGTGRAVVSNVRLSNGFTGRNGKQRLLLHYGDDLSVRMDLSLDPSVKEPSVRILIRDQTLRPVADCYSGFGGFEITRKRASRISLRIKKLQLNAGIYSITIAVVDLSNNEVLARNDWAAGFQVESTYPSYASVLLQGDWREEQC